MEACIRYLRDLLDRLFAADRPGPLVEALRQISEGTDASVWLADAMRPGIVAHSERLLDEVEKRGSRSCDLMADYAYQLPIRVICDLLGIEQDGHQEFIELASKLTRRETGSSFAEFGTALQDIGRYAVGLIVRKRKTLGDDLLSTLIAVRDEDDTQLSNEELVSTVILLLMAGYESTAVQLGNAFFALFRNPDQLARLRAEPDLIENAVTEILRWAQMGTGYAVAKYATADITLSGVTIPSGASVFVSLASANRDEAVFGADSEVLDLGRACAHRQVAFSHGPHYCLGAALARLEMQEGISRLFARFPGLRFDGDLDKVILASNLFTYYPSELAVAW
jgi:cytochrome P450